LSITPDRSKEFSKHPEITSELDNIPFYFLDSHSPWQRGTNENTNGLIREYIAKGIDIDNITEEQIEHYVYKLNTRPRKRFDWKTPTELFNDKVLHLI
ncbi:IS30 family transposase, partial [Staphylococcus sp. EZ-P03]|uniref:IS30 family transposase n=1 Tax=Staphylococcus sp. EZ-P03 TaxID=2282739 RepID=UPI000DF74F72